MKKSGFFVFFLVFFNYYFFRVTPKWGFGNFLCFFQKMPNFDHFCQFLSNFWPKKWIFGTQNEKLRVIFGVFGSLKMSKMSQKSILGSRFDFLLKKVKKMKKVDLYIGFFAKKNKKMEKKVKKVKKWVFKRKMRLF